jgi:maleylpyruvate isomerase
VAVGAVDLAEVRRTVAGALAAQAALDEWLASLDPVDSATPSRLPEWTVGHVLTHIARNADSMRSMFAGRPQYPGGRAQRAADIAAGAGRPWHELVADVGASSAALGEVFGSRTDWSGTAQATSQPRPVAMLPFLRWREVEVHRADLGRGYTFSDMPAGYVRRELVHMEMLWRASKPMGMTPLPQAALAAPPPLRLAWLMGRAEIEGLAPAGIF